MATSKLLIPEMDGTPTQIVFADHAGDFSPTAANDLRHASATKTNVQMALASLANGSYWQTAKFDFGALRCPLQPKGAFEIAATPTAGNTIDAWVAYSNSATAGTGNPGGASGASSAYTGYSSNAAAASKQLEYIGSFVVTAQATATVQQILMSPGPFIPKARYGSLILLNGSGAAMFTDDVEIHIVFDPVFWQGQAA